MPRLNIRYSDTRQLLMRRSSDEMRCNLRTASRLHPFVHSPCVIDHLVICGIKAEETVRQIERIQVSAARPCHGRGSALRVPPRHKGVSVRCTEISRKASPIARKVSKMSVLFDLPPMMNSTLV